MDDFIKGDTLLIKELRETIEEQRNTIKELEETVGILENNNVNMFNEMQDLLRYKHVVNALMFLYKFCKGEADKNGQDICNH